jgi:hypothetical protein
MGVREKAMDRSLGVDSLMPNLGVLSAFEKSGLSGGMLNFTSSGGCLAPETGAWGMVTEVGAEGVVDCLQLCWQCFAMEPSKISALLVPILVP